MPTSRRNFLTTAAGIAAGGTALALAAVPALAVSLDNPQIDGELHQALDDLVEMDAALAALHKKHGDDTDSRDDYHELEARRDDAIGTLISVPASSMAGIKAKVVKLPVPRFTFKATVIDEAKVLANYDRKRVCVATCLHMLKMSPKALKKQVAELDARSPEYVAELIEEIEGCGEDFAILAHFFDSLVARLTVVHRRLI